MPPFGTGRRAARELWGQEALSEHTVDNDDRSSEGGWASRVPKSAASRGKANRVSTTSATSPSEASLIT